MVACTLRKRLTETRCLGGEALASSAEFAAQKQRADAMLDWYAMYVALLRRLESGVTPFCLQNFVGGGGSSEGCRRAGGASHGMDLYPQEDYERRFGTDAFTQMDGLSWAGVKALRDRHGARFMIGGPPCKFYSRARVKGEAKQPPLIAGFRDMCVALFGSERMWAIENVMGAAPHMSEGATVVDGAYFGLRVARARLYETNFPLIIDESVKQPARELAARCCLGKRRRFRRFDEFGRPIVRACCGGNIFALQGTSPWKCTLAECAEAMGVDVGHMNYDRLAQSVPPAYGQLVFSQMCMQMAHRKFGVPVISYDQFLENPAKAQRSMAFWLRGAGAPEASAGQLFVPAPLVASETPGTARAERQNDEGCRRVAEFRELYYSHAGGFTQQWVVEEVAGRLQQVSLGATLDARPTARTWVGENTYVEVSDSESLSLAAEAAAAVRENPSGTRSTFVVSPGLREQMEALGFRYLKCSVGGKGPDALSYQGLVALHVGRRKGVSRPSRLAHDDVRDDMDWRDRGGHEFDPAEKHRLTWEDFPHDPARYRGKGLPAWVEAMMTEGAVIDLVADMISEDVQQYGWPNATALVEAILETDRHLAIGALEYVPDAEVADVLENRVVHPILLVSQGKGKFRACHDYSRGTNRAARSSPFSLPAVWDVRSVVTPSSHFCKYDLRDGFFAVPVHPGSRNNLVVRHPATGRLLRCARLPFGYIDSPRLFCGLTEALADEVRRRVAGEGINVFVFVDDFLIVGDSREAALRGGEVLEQVLFEFGIPWAPHKQRGPAQCMEFLGLLLSNAPGHRCIALTEGRQRKLREQLSLWMGRRPGDGGEYRADVKELASFLGHLVFCSQVVPQGRTYMQAMLSQFAGLEVDWRRGAVRISHLEGAKWRDGIEVGPGFWRDLEWWDERMENRNCTSMVKPERGEVAVCGTDASDWGTGQLLWDSGQRAETVLRFSLAERARSINWRELLGIVRVLEQFGSELRGRTVLVEGDNTSSLAAAGNESSKAEDSQELVRRLVELAEEHELTVRLTHTPGVKLDRPDQTSRGDPMEEPRARLTKDVYDVLAGRFGPFSEWLGAERRYEQASRPTGRVGIWAHPSHSTVGSALRRLGERLGDRDCQDARGVVVVPHDEGAKWWRLVRHFDVVGRLPQGGRHLECNRLGQWRPSTSLRASLILSFPRSAGRARPVKWRVGCTLEGYMGVNNCVENTATYLPLSEGAFVYYSSGMEGKRGVFCLVAGRCFHPPSVNTVEGCTVSCAELLLQKGKGAGGRDSYTLDWRGPPHGSFAAGRQRPWDIEAHMLYDVSTLVKYVSCSDVKTQMGGKPAKGGEELVVSFDWKEAERMIARCEAQGAQAGRELAAMQAPQCISQFPHHLFNRCTVCSGLTPCLWCGIPATVLTVGTGEFLCGGNCAAPGAALGESLQELDSAALGADGRFVEGDGSQENAALAALKMARQSAKEAAAARVRVEKGVAKGGAQIRVPGDVVSKAPPLRCMYGEMLCQGCGGKIGYGRLMQPGGNGMVHLDVSCKASADRALLEAVAKGTERDLFAEVGTGSLKRSVQAAHRLSEARIDRVLECLEGVCGEKAGPKLMCIRGCGRGVHGLACCSFSSGVIALGNLICAHCRAADLITTSCTPPDKLVRRMTESMIAEATSGKANTHKGYSDLSMLERKWQLDLCESSGLSPSSVKLPHTSAEGCYSFCLWLSRDGGRARSLGTTMRQLSSLCAKLEIFDQAGSKRVKSLMKDLQDKGAAVSDPDTQVTSLMIDEMYGTKDGVKVARGTIEESCSKKPATAEVMTARETSLNDFELVGGMRVAEVCGGGDGHGLLANKVCIQVVIDKEVLRTSGAKGETIEARIEDSKTGFSRWTVFMGETLKTRVKTAEHLRAWWCLSEFKIIKERRGAFMEWRPDYWVVRVSLLDMQSGQFENFLKEMEWTTSRVMMADRSATLKYAKERRKAKTLDDDMRYVNVTGGAKRGSNVAEAVAWLQAKGFGKFVGVAEGPLFRATLGSKLTHMPYSPNSTHVHLIPAMDLAFERVQATGQIDPEYEPIPGMEPKFANHSNRRHADRVAMRNAKTTGISDNDVNFFFGWELKKLSEKMLLHYAGLDRVIRLGLRWVTAYV